MTQVELTPEQKAAHFEELAAYFQQRIGEEKMGFEHEMFLARKRISELEKQLEEAKK